MAQKRMFDVGVVDSDAFLGLPLSTQSLYFHLSMRADDDGFIDNPIKIMRIIGANQGDMEQLLQKRYLLYFDSGVMVIKHWRLHNYIRKDRYKPTLYQEEYKQLETKANGVYTDTKKTLNSGDYELGQPNDNQLDAQSSIGKSSIGKNSIDNTDSRNIKMLLKDGAEYILENSIIEDYKRVYKSVDVDFQIEKMRLWLDANPTKRKTKRGMPTFVNGWLSRENDRIQTKPVVQQSTIATPVYSQDETIDEDVEIYKAKIAKFLKENES